MKNNGHVLWVVVLNWYLLCRFWCASFAIIYLGWKFTCDRDIGDNNITDTKIDSTRNNYTETALPVEK